MLREKRGVPGPASMQKSILLLNWHTLVLEWWNDAFSMTKTDLLHQYCRRWSMKSYNTEASVEPRKTQEGAIPSWKYASRICCHIKTIDKLKHQIAEAERIISSANRKRDMIDFSRRMLLKHKGPRSMASEDVAPGSKCIKDDLQAKLAITQNTLLSTRLVSILHLRGNEGIRLPNNGDHSKGETKSSQTSSALDLSPSDCKVSPNPPRMHDDEFCRKWMKTRKTGCLRRLSFHVQ